MICFVFAASAFSGIVATADNANKFTKKAEADLVAFLSQISGEKWSAVSEKDLKKSALEVDSLVTITLLEQFQGTKKSQNKLLQRYILLLY